MKKLNYILGLDVGVNSVGWAVVECKTKKDKKDDIVRHYPLRLEALNARIFQEMVERDTQVPKNVKRRAHRGMRRGIARRRGRRNALIKYLQKIQLLPKEINEGVLNTIGKKFAERATKENFKLASGKDPARGSYPLLMRVFGLDHPLKPDEFGCVLLQLQKRRGYKSNRDAKYDELHAELLKETGEDRSKKTRDPEDAQKEIAEAKTEEEKKEARAVLGGIGELKKQMDKAGAKTLGKFIYKQAQEEEGPMKRITQYSLTGKKGDKETETIYYGDRQLYRDEFDELWEKQAAKLKLKDKDRETIENLIFYQRPLMYPVPYKKTEYKPINTWSGGRLRHLRYNDVGACSIFPDKRRAAKALLASQEYRTWQFINNIKIETGRTKQDLKQEQKEDIYALANDVKKVNRDCTLSIRKIETALGQKINYDNENNVGEDSVSQLIGNRTDIQIADIIGREKWNDIKQQNKQDALVNDLLDIGNKVKLYRRLQKEWGFSGGWDGEAYRLAILELEGGHMQHCHEVVQNILERMRDHGETYYDARKNLGYHDHKPSEDSKELLEEEDIPSVANPRVQKALFEIRRTVNSIIKKYGKPAVIRLELARNLKPLKSNRKYIEKLQAYNRKMNIEAEAEMMKIIDAEKRYDVLAEHRTLRIRYFSREDRTKYKMWKQQKYQCLYCFKLIGKRSLFGGDAGAQVDHILPQSAFRQNFMNTVLVCQTCNQEKGDRIPFEAWGGTQKWERIEEKLALTKSGKKDICKEYPEVPAAKIRRILQKKFDPTKESEFVQSQLNDTRYFSILAKNLLRQLGAEVQITKGQAAALLRDLWGFDTILPRHPDDKIAYEVVDTKTGELIDGGKFDPDEIKEHSSKLKPDQIIRATHQDEEEIKKIKNRQDHRHHAIDAFIAAMTDRSVFIRLTRLGQLEMQKNKATSEADRNALENNIKKIKKGIREPESWMGDKVMRRDIEKIIIPTVVSHQQQQNKIYGALHEESCYAKSCYLEKMEINTRKPTIKQLQEYFKAVPEANEIVILLNDKNKLDKSILDASPEANGTVTWILRKQERDAIRQWSEKVKEWLKKIDDLSYLSEEEIKTFPLPILNDKPLDKIVLAHRCYVIRKKLDEKLFKYVKKEWKPGTGYWIMDEAVHKQLASWLETHKEKIKEGLKKDPPRMKSKNGTGNLIQSVRIAKISTEKTIREIRKRDVIKKKKKLKKGEVFDLGSNHHIELFNFADRNTKEQKVKDRVVSMLEAARRRSRKEPIVDRNPDRNWDGEGWKFWMTLKINDMVLWDEEDKRVEKYLRLGKLFYRVQKIAMSGDITFRHHSISSSSDTGRHGLIQASASTLNCKKISVDVLGDYQE